VGATPTVIRAAVMGTIVVVGQPIERPAHAWTPLSAACWAMTIWDPQTLWDMGFQLSALATASLFAFGKGTEALLLKTPLRVSWLDWAREALTATLAAQILALPLILYQFGNLSIIAPLANVALLPIVPSAMLLGALSLVGGMVWLPLGQWLAVVAYLFLAWLTEARGCSRPCPTRRCSCRRSRCGCCWDIMGSWWAGGYGMRRCGARWSPDSELRDDLLA